jgi:hypothetical protein
MASMPIASVTELSFWIKKNLEKWLKAYTPWGSPCTVILKGGQIHKVNVTFGHIKETDLAQIALGREAQKEMRLQRIPRFLSIIDWDGTITNVIHN